MSGADFGSVLLLRCESCGYELEGDEGEIIDLALSDEAECPECGGLYDLVEVRRADELQEFKAACRDLSDGCAMIVERQPALRLRVEEMLTRLCTEIEKPAPADVSRSCRHFLSG